MQLDVAALSVNVAALAPVFMLGGLAMLVLILGLATGKSQGPLLAALTVAGLAVTAAVTMLSWNVNGTAFGRMMAVDNFYVFFAILSLAATGLAVVLSTSYTARMGLAYPEFFALLVFGASGMLVMVAATNVIVLLVGIELLSLALYVLAGFTRTRLTSEEAALKYFLLGSFAIGILIYGSALIYGSTGSLDYSGIAQALKAGPHNLMLLAGIGMVLVGFAFKLSMVPFHMWVPDVYEGSPTPVTAFMAVGTKAAVFAALIRLLSTALPAAQAEWAPVLAALAALTMIVGNVAAVMQTSVKRLLGYSAIAHAGYVMTALVALGTNAVLFYLVAYTAMNLGAFAVMVAVSEGTEERAGIKDYEGLAQRNPWLAGAMTVFLLSLAGVPPTAGFLGKLYVFEAAVQGGYLWLAIIGVLTSVVALYYYLKVLAAMWMVRPGTAVVGSRATASAVLVVAVALFFTVQLGLLPGLYLDVSHLPAVALGK
ncbi:MAG TPA: NADH-quinone oxidoreductase subunit N [Chloroflexota bacterium]